MIYDGGTAGMACEDNVFGLGFFLPAYGCSFSPAEFLVLLEKSAELDYQSSPRRQKEAGGR